jgi:hypothetical protein
MYAWSGILISPGYNAFPVTLSKASGLGIDFPILDFITLPPINAYFFFTGLICSGGTSVLPKRGGPNILKKRAVMNVKIAYKIKTITMATITLTTMNGSQILGKIIAAG